VPLDSEMVHLVLWLGAIWRPVLLRALSGVLLRLLSCGRIWRREVDELVPKSKQTVLKPTASETWQVGFLFIEGIGRAQSTGRDKET
jgi:hypothetical protein